MSPYFVATGLQPLIPMDLVLCDLKVSATKDFLKRIKKLWSTIYQRETHQAMKDEIRADKVQQQSTIQVGDLATLSTCNLVLEAITGKLKPICTGPFQVEAKMGANTFKLTLPTTMRVHPVFNV